MNNTKIMSLSMLVALIVFAGIYFLLLAPRSSKKNLVSDAEENLGTWEFSPSIASPLTSTTSQQNNTTLGDLSNNKVQVKIDQGAFDSETEISLTNPSNVPQIDTNTIDTIGAPIELLSNKEHRLNEKATVTFAFDKDKLPQDTQEYQLRVAYYNGKNWDYIKPTNVDFDGGKVSFETYHFSLLGLTKLKSDTTITQQWIKSQALDNKLKENTDATTDEIAGKVVDLMLEKIGISDKSIKGQVIGDVLKDDSYKDIYDAYKSGDIAGFNQKVAMLAGKKIASNVPESVMSEALGNISGDAAGDVEAVAKAAGYMAEGQYKEAAKILGENIADKFLITTATKIAVEVVDGQIQSWKNSEIEAAYKAYKDGANNYFYGYNVDSGDFDGVWSQMRGIGRQLELEAINKENNIRKESGMPELNEKQIEIIRENVKQTYKKQFENRQKQEDEIQKEEDKLKAIFGAFEEAGFLGRIPPKGLDKGYDLETRLGVLNHFVEKMMKDTSRFEITDKKGLLVEDKISLDDLVQGTRIYFSGPEGPEEYRKFLQDRFGISMYPKLEDIAGEYTGTITITKFVVPEELTDEMKASLEDAGCEASEVNIDTETVVDKEQPMQLQIKKTSENGGVLIAGEDSDKQEIPFTYVDGKITINTVENEAVLNAEFIPMVSDSGVEMSGNASANFKSIFELEATMSVTKK